MNLNIALLPGDGVGPEVVAQAVKCLQAVEETFNHRFVPREALVGAAAITKKGRALPEQTLNLCREADAILLGTLGDPRYENNQADQRPQQALLDLRKNL